MKDYVRDALQQEAAPRGGGDVASGSSDGGDARGRGARLQCVVLDLGSCAYIDSTAVQFLGEIDKDRGGAGASGAWQGARAAMYRLHSGSDSPPIPRACAPHCLLAETLLQDLERTGVTLMLANPGKRVRLPWWSDAPTECCAGGCF